MSNAAPPRDATAFYQAVRYWAAEQPEKDAVGYLADAQQLAAKWTYGELDRYARAVAAHLQALDARGQRALLLFPPGIEFVRAFLGCLYAGVVAVPAYPPVPSRLMRTLPRLKTVAAEADAALVLTTETGLSLRALAAPHAPDLDRLEWVAVDTLDPARSADWEDPRLPADWIAFLQYTSGTTSDPKGVMVSNANLLANEAMLNRAWSTSAQDIWVGWTPLEHDMGLIGNLLHPLYTGASVYLMSPLSFLKRPLRWLQAMSALRGTVMGGPNFGYELCLRALARQGGEGLDLSSVAIAYNGAEPVRATTLRRFSEAFAAHGFRPDAFLPCYGLADATLYAAGGRRGKGPILRDLDAGALEAGQARAPDATPSVQLAGARGARTLVSSGEVAPGAVAAIVDPARGVALEDGRIGEIWLAGPHIAQGYWRRPETSAAVFRACLPADPRPYLRTGDLGFLRDGELFVTGRLKELIIVRGRNHYPHDIEHTVESCHAALRPGCGAVFSIDRGEQEQLIVAHEVDVERLADDTLEQLLQRVRQAVVETHDIEPYDVVLLEPRAVPKTSSGKTQRVLCRERYETGQLPAVAAVHYVRVQHEPAAAPDAPGSAASANGPLNALQWARWLASALAERLGQHREAIDVRAPFSRLGVDSLQAVALVGELEERLGQALDPTLLYSYPTVEALADHLAQLAPPDAPSLSLAAASPVPTARGREPIAIVGIGLRFPGASSPAELWQLLSAGVDMVREVPPDRWDAAAYYDPDNITPGSTMTRWGGFIDRPGAFDYRFFGIERDEARAMDPQQRMLLEVAWETFEDAGVPPAALAGARVGVFVGICAAEYGQAQLGDLRALRGNSALGAALSIAANRLSYVYDLRGPSLAIDTACSSSLVAVEQACRSLWESRASAALVGGANLIYSPALAVGFSRAGVMAPDGRCKTFDARANGYVRAEGVGMVLLKPLSRALADGNRIYALIRGAAVNHDGRTNGLMAPSALAQAELLEEAYRDAGVDPNSTTIVEAHGTGTAVGDLIEARAIAEVLAARRSSERPLYLGSLKANLGHLEAAAGIAGLIKLALVLERREIPPAPHFERPNPLLPLSDGALRVATEPTALVGEAREGGSIGPIAGVSSFGFGGTNAHVVLEGWSKPSGAHEQFVAAKHGPGGALQRERLVVLSARSDSSLRELVGRWLGWLDPRGDARAIPFEAIALASRTQRTHHDHRLAILASDHAQARQALACYLAGEEHPRLWRSQVPGVRRLAFVFAGQGTEWAGMGQQLLSEAPAFARKLREVDEALAPHFGRSVIELLRWPDEAQWRRPDVVQPLLFALEVALAALWRDWGVRPDAVIGHSYGEVVAAYEAGALSLAAAARLIVARGQVTQSLVGQGKMALVNLPAQEIQALLAGSDAWIAAVNSPVSCLVSGRGAAIDALLGQLEARGVHARALRVAFPAHTPLMQEAGRTLSRTVEGLDARPTKIAWASTVSAALMEGSAAGPAYWADNLIKPVRFSEAIRQLAQSGIDAFLEISPRSALASAMDQSLEASSRARPLLAASLRKEEDEARAIQESLAQLYAGGVALSWSDVTVHEENAPERKESLICERGRDEAPAYSFFPGRGDGTSPRERLRSDAEAVGSRVALPPYAWDHEDLWVPWREVSPSAEPGAREGVAEVAPLVRTEVGRAEPSPAPGASHDCAPTAVPQTEDALRALLAAQLAQVLRRQPTEIDPAVPLGDLGIDSLMSVQLKERLERHLGLRLSATLLWNYPTLDALTKHLSARLGSARGELVTQGSEPSPARRSEPRRPSAPATPSIAPIPSIAPAAPAPKPSTRARGGAYEPIAIVGMACRFPGAPNIERFWQLLRAGGDAVTEIPRERWSADDYYDADPAARAKTTTRWGGFVEHVDLFDPGFFGISPREAAGMDPQQRLTLETSCEALEDAGVPLSSLSGSDTGVFVGVYNLDYLLLQAADPRMFDAYTAAGNSHSVLANRLSFHLDLKGPSLAIDTACSSSLVAVHTAACSLQRGECDLALAGGVNLLVSPLSNVVTSKVLSMAADGRCKAFDARADGLVRGEGCGIVVLRRLDDALRRGDHIWAVVRGSAVNHDGRSMYMTAPSGPAQQAVVRSALAAAELPGTALEYVEAHGTGTPLGDPIELEALAAVVGEGEPPSEGSSRATCWVGSVKTNIGHLEAAAGVAGLIKTALALDQRSIPPTLHFRELNPQIDLGNSRIQIADQPRPWSSNGAPRHAGVSSFGLGGTNAHVVLEEAPAVSSRSLPSLAQVAPAEPAPQLLLLSSKTESGLKQQAERWLAFLAREGETHELPQIASAAARRRDHHAHRLALVGASVGRWREQLSAFLAGQIDAGVALDQVPSASARRLAFVFPGQGAQWVGMGRELLQRSEAFREAMERLDAAIASEAGWSVLEALHAGAAEGRLERVDVVQPLLFALQVGLVAQWRAWGVEPEAVVGHSMGEVAAAHVAGILSLEDAAAVICRRSRLLRRVSGRGAMALVGLDVDETERLTRAEAGSLSIAVSNSSRSTVIAGDAAAIERVLRLLEAQGTFCRRIQVEVASHSPQVDGLLAPLTAALAGLGPVAGRIRFQSTVDGVALQGPELTADYWARNLRSRVRFGAALRQLVDDGVDTFVEISPHALLASAVRDIGQEAGRELVSVASLKREASEAAALLEALAQLHVSGAVIDWGRVLPLDAPYLRVPGYAWNHQRCWVAERPRGPARGRSGAATHLFLQDHVQAADARDGRDDHVFNALLDDDAVRCFDGHRVGGEVLVPAAAMIDAALAAARAVYPAATSIELRELRIERALPLSAELPRETQVILRRRGGEHRFGLFSRPADGAQAPWIQHAHGKIVLPEQDGSLAHEPSWRAARELCERAVDPGDQYSAFERAGLCYEGPYRGLAQIWSGPAAACAELAAGASASRPHVALPGRAHVVEPAELDCAFQLVGTALPRAVATGGDLFLPVGVAHVRWCASGPEQAESTSRAWVRLADDGVGRQHYRADGGLIGPGGAVSFEGFTVARTALGGHDVARSSYELAWSLLEPVEARGEAPASAYLVYGDDGTARALVARIRARGRRCVQIISGTDYARRAEDTVVLDPSCAGSFDRALAQAFCGSDSPDSVFALFDGARAESGDAPDPTDMRDVLSALHLAQALLRAQAERDGAPPRLAFVTRGVHAVTGGERAIELRHAPVVGFSRVLRLEHPELRCLALDLDPERESSTNEAAASEAEALLALLDERGTVQEAALRQQRWFVPALRSRAELHDASFERAWSEGAGRVSLRIGEPRSIEALRFERATEALEPSAGEVVIRVKAAGLNFRDVLSALGVDIGYTGELGKECAGLVEAVGSGVSQFAPGDSVVAISDGALANLVKAPASLTFSKPASLSFETAAASLLAFITARYALVELARLQPGQRVLVHAASGGVGLAAIQLARRAGAEVIASAGSDAKRRYLRSLGVERVVDSRGDDLLGAVQQLTGGDGVDVVLNSLTGAALRDSVALLRAGGVFVELGRTAISEVERACEARQDVAFQPLDLVELCREQPEVVGRQARAILAELSAGELAPLPQQLFAFAEAARAFRLMARARHIGKVVLHQPDGQASRVRPAGAPGTILVTGGLGGLGQSAARWLAQNGATHLALLGRSPHTPLAERALDELRQLGARVIAIQADVADGEALALAIDSLAQKGFPALRGVVHAAGLLDDGVVLQQDARRMAQVMRPKVVGAWNLHRATRDLQLDFFVMFSSAATVLGSPGQSNYAAANAFMDGLAAHRRVLGLPATSIAWGPWSEVGLAARPDRGGRLELQGIASFSPARGAQAFGEALRGGSTYLALMDVDWAALARAFPPIRELLLVRELIDGGGAAPSPRAGGSPPGWLAARLDALEAGERHAEARYQIQQQLARIMGFKSGLLPDAQQGLFDMGLDSLMAVELRHQLEAAMGRRLPTTLTFDCPTIDALARYLVAPQSDRTAQLGDEPSSPQEPASEQLWSNVAQLSEEDAERLLAARLAALQETA